MIDSGGSNYLLVISSKAWRGTTWDYIIRTASSIYSTSGKMCLVYVFLSTISNYENISMKVTFKTIKCVIIPK